jgi:Pyruvate/2-oxoacid:ferredoxin oxidoreductase delta subunit
LGVDFLVYSGTGNSLRVARWMAAAVREAGLPSEVSRLLSGSDGRADPATRVALVFPTHGFTAPVSVLKAAWALPHGGGREAYVIATRGGTHIAGRLLPGYEGSAAWLVALILLAKGYCVRGIAGVDMPSNWTALHPGLSPDAVAVIEARSERRAMALVAEMLSGRRVAPGRLSVLLAALLLPVSLGYLMVGRHFLSGLYFASDRCVGCGLCAESCPHGAIEMVGVSDRARPMWTLRCETCMRCMAYCPTQAIEASYALGLAAYGPVATPVGRRVLDSLSRWLPRRLVTLTVGALLLVATRPWNNRMLHNPWLNWLATHTTPTHWYRRYHEPSTRLQDLTG